MSKRYIPLITDRGAVEAYLASLKGLLSESSVPPYPFARTGIERLYAVLRRLEKPLMPLRLDVLGYTGLVVEARGGARPSRAALVYRTPRTTLVFTYARGDPAVTCRRRGSGIVACGRILPLVTPDPGLEARLTEALRGLGLRGFHEVLAARLGLKLMDSYWRRVQALARHALGMYVYRVDGGDIAPPECKRGCKNKPPRRSYTPIALIARARDPTAAYKMLARQAWELAMDGLLAARSVIVDEHEGILAAVVWAEWSRTGERLVRAVTGAGAEVVAMEPVVEASSYWSPPG